MKSADLSNILSLYVTLLYCPQMFGVFCCLLVVYSQPEKVVESSNCGVTSDICTAHEIVST